MLFAIGTDTNEFAGYRACKCLNNFYRTHLFEDCKPCDQPGLQCVHDFATLRSGYWWKWRNETDKMIYKTFTEGLKNAGVTPVVRTKNVASEGSYIEYPYSLPQPQKCPREKSCIGGLVSLCAVGFEGPLCEICSKGFHKQLKSCNKYPTKKWMIGQLSVLATVILVIIVIVVWTSRKKRQEKRRAFLSRYHSWEAKDSHRFLSSNVGSSWSILVHQMARFAHSNWRILPSAVRKRLSDCSNPVSFWKSQS